MTEKFLHNELIAMAIWDSPKQMLTIGDIVKYIRNIFKYFKRWKEKKMHTVFANVLLTDDIFVTVGFKPPHLWESLWTIREEVGTQFHGGGPLQWRKIINKWKKSMKKNNSALCEDQTQEERWKLIDSK